jgi:uncharacterized repeat protein (TIGR03803 family)
MVLMGDTLYGTSRYGGSGGPPGNGTVFRLKTDGSGFGTLHNFAGYPTDGAGPIAGLVLYSNTLYGTATGGGSSGNGMIFSISLPPQLTITAIGPNLVLTWPTNAAGFALQSATNLASPIWTTNLPTSIVVNGQTTVTNPIAATQQYFRLSQ